MIPTWSPPIHPHKALCLNRVHHGGSTGEFIRHPMHPWSARCSPSGGHCECPSESSIGPRINRGCHLGHCAPTVVCRDPLCACAAPCARKAQTMWESWVMIPTLNNVQTKGYSQCTSLKNKYGTNCTILLTGLRTGWLTVVFTWGC